MNQPILEPDGSRLIQQTTRISYSPAKKAPATAPAYATVEALVKATRPAEPVYVIRPHVIARKARAFLSQFPGDVLYAVKTNPDTQVLRILWQAGVRHFDVASIVEVRSVAKLSPKAQMYFMHPVKSREAIAEAYFKHHVRDFSLDTHEELEKILQVTGYADDLNLHVRLSISNDKAAYALAGKFGVNLEDAPSLMRATRRAAKRFGMCFHVGSQCMDPSAYATAIGYVVDLLTTTDVKLDMLDIGGGFPSAYPGMMPPALDGYMAAIKQSLAQFPMLGGAQLLCEPGRALVAEGGSTVVRVELRKGNKLYLNDGAFGSLFDAAYTDFKFPVKAVRVGHPPFAGNEEAFSFFGPTCDSMDVIKGPYLLPADIGEGDWIEIGQLGAYGATMATRFNGFHSEETALVRDEPILVSQ